jgi:RNA polymerase sigma-70 factor, ECF subfamily
MQVPEAQRPPDRPPELDRLTLARAQRGDAPARRALVLRYQRPVFAVLSRLVLAPGGRAQVEDLAQETFLRVFRALPEFEPEGAARLSSWILTIATRLALDFLRREKRRSAPLPVVTSRAPGPDAALRRKELGRRIQAAVASLPPTYQAAFVLREYHGMAYEEIGAALDCDLGTVKSRLSRARAALREALAEERSHG